MRTTDIENLLAYNVRKGSACTVADELSEPHRIGTKPVISDAAAAGQAVKSLCLTQLLLPAYP